jgi:hypothetical protein
MTKEKLFPVSEVINRMITEILEQDKRILFLEMDDQIFHIIIEIMSASILAKATSKDEATEIIASLAAHWLTVCKEYSNATENFWRKEGKTVQ